MAIQDKVNTAKEVLADSRARMVIVILGIIVVVILVVAYFKLKGSDAKPGGGLGSATVSTPDISSIPGMGTPTREYEKLQEQQNIQLAEEAARKGTAATPTLVRSTYLEAGASADLSKGSGATSAEGCDLESLKRARSAGVSAADLKAAGFSAKDLKDAGFSAKELKDAGFSAADLNKAGFSAKDLIKAGYSPSELKKAGFSDEEIAAAGGRSLAAGDDDIQKELEKIRAEQLARMNVQQKANLLNQMQGRMMQQANQLFSAWTPIPSQAYVQGAPPPKKKDAACKDEAGKKGKVDLKNSNVFKAGSIIFAVLDTGINSDETSPVMATIVQGRLNGSKVLGTFQRTDKKVLLQFSVLSVPKLDNSIGINAVAIDPNTAKTALASKVDNHYFLKYGSLFASSFMSGLGQSVQNAGSQVQTSATSSVVTTPALNTMEKMLVAFGNTAQQFGQAMAVNMNKPPTVTVNAGTSIGLLLMADLVVPKNKKFATKR